MTGQEIYNKLTDYWKTHGVEGSDEFALLTNLIHQEWTGLASIKRSVDAQHAKPGRWLGCTPSTSNSPPNPRANKRWVCKALAQRAAAKDGMPRVAVL
jgi:hypothetical protein